MTKLAAVADYLNADTLALIEQLALERGISSDQYAANAAKRVAEEEAELTAFVQIGIDAADRGDLIPHEEIMAELERMRAKYEARCR